MRETAFILAAGEASRFDGPETKQLLKVDGVPVINRMVGLCGEYNLTPVVVTHNLALAPPGSVGFAPGKSTCTCETILSTRGLWMDRVIILLGDVYYTGPAFRDIAIAHRSPMFFTDGQDLFALSFKRQDFGACVKALETAVSLAGLPEGNLGRIWEMYRAMYGLKQWPIIVDRFDQPNPNPEHLSLIADRTQDFDTMADYQNFLNGATKNFALAHANDKR